MFVGPTAIAFIKGEPVDAAKAMKTFAKDNKALVIKGGYMDGAALTVAQVEASPTSNRARCCWPSWPAR